MGSNKSVTAHYGTQVVLLYGSDGPIDHSKLEQMTGAAATERLFRAFDTSSDDSCDYAFRYQLPLNRRL